MKLIIECLDDALFKVNELLLADLNVPLVLDQAYHAVEAGRDWLLKLS